MLKMLHSLCRPPQDKPTERPAGWHPGPHGHHLRAQILAYFYLDMLHAAIQGEDQIALCRIEEATGFSDGQWSD
jgi:hypothetical protein